MNLVIIPHDMPNSLASKVASIRFSTEPGSTLPPQYFFDSDAAAWAERRRKLLQPGNREKCQQWMASMAACVNGLTDDVLAKREAAVWLRCYDMPEIAWCQATINIVTDRSPYLPTPGEVHAAMEQFLAPLRQEIEILDRLAKAPIEQPMLYPSEPREPYVVNSVPDWCKDRGI